MRASARHHEVIAVPADEAWAAVTRPELLDRFFPGIERCEVVGDVRTVTLRTGLSLEEHIVLNDALQRRFQYRIAGGVFREHLATIDVLPLDDGRCLVSYASDAEPATMAVILGGAMRSALDSLKQQLESGEGPLVDALSGPAATASAAAS